MRKNINICFKHSKSTLYFRRRRKQRKALNTIASRNLSSRHLDTSGTSSRAQLVTPFSSPPTTSATGIDAHHRANASQSVHYPVSTPSFSQSTERYHRESRSDFDLHHNTINGVDYRYNTSIPPRSRSAMTNAARRPYGTIDYSSANIYGSRRRSLPKSFSDCDLCKRQVFTKEYQHYHDEHDDNWHLEDAFERRAEPRAYREKIKERFRERLTVRKVPDTDVLPPSTTTVEYSTVLPRHQRIGSEPNYSHGPVHHLPFQYVPNENSKNIRTVEYKRNSSQERFAIGNNQQHSINDDSGSTNFTVKFYERDDYDDDIEHRLNQCLHEAREIQEMSMRMSDQQQQNFNRYPYQHPQPRHFAGNVDI